LVPGAGAKTFEHRTLEQTVSAIETVSRPEWAHAFSDRYLAPKRTKQGST